MDVYAEGLAVSNIIDEGREQHMNIVPVMDGRNQESIAQLLISKPKNLEEQPQIHLDLRESSVRTQSPVQQFGRPVYAVEQRHHL